MRKWTVINVHHVKTFENMQLLRFVLVSIDKISNFFWTYSTQWHKNSTFTSTITINKNSEATNTHPFNGPFQGLPGWVGTRKAKNNLDSTEARDSEWQWHQLGHMQVCTSLQTDNHASTPPLSSSKHGRQATNTGWRKKHKVAEMQHNVAFLHFKYPHIYQQIAKKHTTKYSAILLKVNSTVQKMHSHMLFLSRITQKVTGRF